MAERNARRLFLFGGAFLATGAAVFGAHWFNIFARLEGDGTLSVQDAHRLASQGDLVLVDIRRPEEWQNSGIGVGAAPLDMRRRDFVEQLLELTDGRMDAPVALICATGVRSRRLASALSDAGFSNVQNVPEGMFGSGAGPGWLRSKLPVTQP